MHFHTQNIRRKLCHATFSPQHWVSQISANGGEKGRSDIAYL